MKAFMVGIFFSNSQSMYLHSAIASLYNSFNCSNSNYLHTRASQETIQPLIQCSLHSGCISFIELQQMQTQHFLPPL